MFNIITFSQRCSLLFPVLRCLVQTPVIICAQGFRNFIGVVDSHPTP